MTNQLSSHQKTAAIVGLFVAIGFAVYGYSVFTNDFVSFDDGLLIYDNISVIRAGSLWAVQWAFANYDPELYIPLTFLSLQLDAIIGGLHPFIFHFNNLLQHITSALLITWIVQLLFKRLDIAVILGLVFLVHPLNVETVAWAASRKDTLSSLFFFATIVAYLRYKETHKALLHYWSIGLFILGLLAKVSVIPLPLVLLCIDWYQNTSLTWKDVWQKKGYILAAIPFGLLALLGKDVVLVRSSPINIALLVPKTTFFYIQKILAPFHLSIFYSIDPSEVTVLNSAILIPLLLAVFSVMLLWIYRKRIRTVITGAVIMFVILIPSFFQYYRGNYLYYATDRYMYLPFIGVLIMIAALLLRVPKQRYTAMYITSGIVLSVLSIGTFRQSLVWKDAYTLFIHSLRFDESFLAYEKVGSELWDQGKTAEAITALKRSIALSPNSSAYLRLAIIAKEQGLIEEAKLLYLEALSLSPDFAQAHTNIGQLYWDEGRQYLAIEHSEKAVLNHPWNMMALGNLASMYTLTGQKEKALDIIDQILLLEPNNERLGPLLRKLGVQ